MTQAFCQFELGLFGKAVCRQCGQVVQLTLLEGRPLDTVRQACPGRPPQTPETADCGCGHQPAETVPPETADPATPQPEPAVNAES